MLLLIILITTASFLQSTILPIGLPSALILWAITSWRENSLWPTILISGLILDLIIGFPLGISSLYYLIIALTWWLYKQKYHPYHPLFLFIFITGSVIIYHFLTLHKFAWIPALIWAVIFIFFRKYLMETQIDRYKLRV